MGKKSMGTDGAADDKKPWDDKKDKKKEADKAPDMSKAKADDDDEDEDDDMDKSFSMSELRDAVTRAGDNIAKHLATNDPRARREALLAKAMANGGDLGQEDKAELIARLQGASDNDSLAARAGEQVTQGDDISKAMGSSPAFDTLAKGLSKAVSTMAGDIEKSTALFTDTSMLLLKHQQIMAKGLSSLSEQMETLHAAQKLISEQPQGGPRSAGIRPEAPAIRKSVDTGRGGTGGEAEGTALKPEEIKKGLRKLHRAAIESGDNRAKAHISKSMMDFDMQRMPDQGLLNQIAQTLSETSA